MGPCLSQPDVWESSNRDEVFARLRERDPVTWQDEPETVWSGRGRGYWAVVRHADVREVTRDTGRFVSGLGTELFDLPVDIARSYSGMLNMDAPEHTAVQGVCQRSLLGTSCRWARAQHSIVRDHRPR